MFVITVFDITKFHFIRKLETVLMLKVWHECAKTEKKSCLKFKKFDSKIRVFICERHINYQFGKES